MFVTEVGGSDLQNLIDNLRVPNSLVVTTLEVGRING